MKRISPQALFLIVEALILAVLSIWCGLLWLLPAAGLLALLGILQTRVVVVPGMVLAIGATLYWLFGSEGGSGIVPPVSFAVIALVAGTACAFLGILTSLSKIKATPTVQAIGRLAVAFHFVASGIFLAAPYASFPMPSVFAWICADLSLILVIDTFFKLAARLYTPRRHWGTLAEPGAFFFYHWLGQDWRDCFPSVGRDADHFSLKLAEMWLWPSLRRQIFPLGGVALFIAWMAGGVHEIGVGFSGVRHSFGKWKWERLAPGFHFSLPWPLGGIHMVDTGRVHETVLGFRADPGQPILWERAHYEGEQLSLVGGGDDFLSISVPIHYRVEDPAAYLRGAADPARLVRDAGNRILLDLTLHLTAAEVMTVARESIRREFHLRLQQDLDRESSGIEIEQVCLRDVHPAVEVAPSFQEVMAAMEEKEANLHDAESYRRDFGTRARSDAFTLVTNAGSGADNRLSQVKGEARRFSLRREAWLGSPALFQLREGFRIFDDALTGGRKAIFDKGIGPVMNTQLDLRRVLNPDLLSNSPPPPETLVPRPGKSRDAFDLDIDGFLKLDRGEIPSVSAAPPDADNLLKTESSEQ